MRSQPLRLPLLVTGAALLVALLQPGASPIRPQDIGSEDAGVMQAALQKIWSRSSAGQDVTRDLLQGLESPVPRIRGRCIRLLGHLELNESSDAVASKLRDPDLYVRIQAALALRTLRSYRDPGPLLHTLEDPRELARVRANVAWSLATRREPAADAAFARVAADPTQPEELRLECLRGLGSQGNPGRAGLLTRVLHSEGESRVLRRQAAFSLGRNAAKEAGPALTRLAMDPHREDWLRGDAAFALAYRATPPPAGWYRRLLAGADHPLYLRIRAAESLWILGESPGDVADLVRAGLGAPEADTRHEAAWLADLDEVIEVRDELAAALQVEPDGRARGQMQKTLERLHPLEIGDPDRALLD